MFRAGRGSWHFQQPHLAWQVGVSDTMATRRNPRLGRLHRNWFFKSPRLFWHGSVWHLAVQYHFGARSPCLALVSQQRGDMDAVLQRPLESRSSDLPQDELAAGLSTTAGLFGRYG